MNLISKALEHCTWIHMQVMFKFENIDEQSVLLCFLVFYRTRFYSGNVTSSGNNEGHPMTVCQQNRLFNDVQPRNPFCFTYIYEFVY